MSPQDMEVPVHNQYIPLENNQETHALVVLDLYRKSMSPSMTDVYLVIWFVTWRRWLRRSHGGRVSVRQGAEDGG